MRVCYSSYYYIKMSERFYSKPNINTDVSGMRLHYTGFPTLNRGKCSAWQLKMLVGRPNLILECLGLNPIPVSQ